MEILNWLRQNATLVSTVANLGMFFVWAFYASWLYWDYKRRRRPRLMIHQTHGSNPGSQCLLINLSQETALMEGILVEAVSEDSTFTRQITEYGYESQSDGMHPDPRAHFKQGPIGVGDMITLGSFGELIEQATDRPLDEAIQELGIERLEIKAVITFGSANHSVGALRTYSISADGALIISPEGLATVQMASRSQRRQVDEWLKECLDPESSLRPLQKSRV